MSRQEWESEILGSDPQKACFYMIGTRVAPCVTADSTRFILVLSIKWTCEAIQLEKGMATSGLFRPLQNKGLSHITA